MLRQQQKHRRRTERPPRSYFGARVQMARNLSWGACRFVKKFEWPAGQFGFYFTAQIFWRFRVVIAADPNPPA